MKKLIYIANVRLPTEKAHGVQIVKMCEAFANHNMSVNLVIPKRKQINQDLINQDPYEYYGVKNNFKIKRVFNLDLLPLHQKGINTYGLAYLIQELSFSLSVSLKYIIKPNNHTFFTRSKYTALLLSLLGKNVTYEAHSPVSSFIDKLVARRCQVVGISKSIVKSWKKVCQKVIYSPDAVSSEFFNSLTKKKARKKLNLPSKQKIVLYTGNLYPWKGIDTILKAANKAPLYHFYIVGGSVIDKNIKPLQKKAKKQKNIHIIGHKPYKQIPVWLKAADVLVIPNSAKHKQSQEHTSPLKLFEYLASGRPILASKVIANTEILSENNAHFFKPDSHDDLVKVLKSMKIKNTPVKKNVTLAQKYSWGKRAQSIKV